MGSAHPIAFKAQSHVLQHASCADGDNSAIADSDMFATTRKTSMDYLNKVYCSEPDAGSLRDILSQHEQHISSQCASFECTRMYFFCELYAQLRLAPLDNHKRDLGKRITFLLTKKKQFISRLYFYFVDGTFAAFDRTEFIGVSDENRTHLLASNPCTLHTISTWKLYAENRLDEQSLAIWGVYEAHFKDFCVAHCNLYSFIAGHAIASLHFNAEILRS